jgi:superfamily II RNA helicase
MQDSYWFQQQEKERQKLQKDREACEAKKASLCLEEPYFSECAKRVQLEESMRAAVNAERKALQRQLDTVKNRQLGPKWTKALADYHARYGIEKELEALVAAEQAAGKTAQTQVNAVAAFLCHMGYLQHSDLQQLTAEHMGLKGILATEVNEAHPILLTEIYQEGVLQSLTGQELVCVLACFLEAREVQPPPSGSAAVVQAIERLQALGSEFEEVEKQFPDVGVREGYWQTTTEMVEPMRRWMEGDAAATICEDHGLFEGNFIRAVMKVANMLDECLSLATYCQHTDMVEKIDKIRGSILRDVVTSDSLYLRL